MKEFKPSGNFVSRVMENVDAYERQREESLSFHERILYSRPLRYAMSGSGIFIGIFFTPAACL